MKKTESEKYFEEYREYLRKEASRLATYTRLHRRLHERRTDRLDEMNIAPAFFRSVIDALFSVIVLWADKLCSERSERGMCDFLTFCENNLDLFEIKELQRRGSYPDGHWMLEREPITFQLIQKDKESLRKIGSLQSFRVRRDRFHAHFDKEYFFDRKKLSKDAPLKWSDPEEVVQVIKHIINSYSAAYDGNMYVLEPMNATDIDRLLDILHERGRKGD